MQGFLTSSFIPFSSAVTGRFTLPHHDKPSTGGPNGAIGDAEDYEASRRFFSAMSYPETFIRCIFDRRQQLILNTRETNMDSQAKTKHPGYMLLFRGNDWHKGLSPEEMQQVASHWMAWFNRLTVQGKAVAGNPLEPEGRIISGKNGRVISDGPFAESKEAIGGYFLLQVDTMSEAVAIAKECPGLPYGSVVEVRPVAEECPIAEEIERAGRLAQAAA
jgi:hypothetical protein